MLRRALIFFVGAQKLQRDGCRWRDFFFDVRRSKRSQRYHPPLFLFFCRTRHHLLEHALKWTTDFFFLWKDPFLHRSGHCLFFLGRTRISLTCLPRRTRWFRLQWACRTCTPFPRRFFATLYGYILSAAWRWRGHTLTRHLFAHTRGGC